MKTTLLIMAAGIGSRFGTGIKQLEPVDDAGHIIMDYSIHDALEAGCNKVVFIIRKDIEEEFRTVIGNRKICQLQNPFGEQNPLINDMEDRICQIQVQITAARDEVFLKDIKIY